MRVILPQHCSLCFWHGTRAKLNRGQNHCWNLQDQTKSSISSTKLLKKKNWQPLTQESCRETQRKSNCDISSLDWLLFWSADSCPSVFFNLRVLKNWQSFLLGLHCWLLFSDQFCFCWQNMCRGKESFSYLFSDVILLLNLQLLIDSFSLFLSKTISVVGRIRIEAEKFFCCVVFWSVFFSCWELLPTILICFLLICRRGRIVGRELFSDPVSFFWPAGFLICSLFLDDLFPLSLICLISENGVKQIFIAFLAWSAFIAALIVVCWLFSLWRMLEIA